MRLLLVVLLAAALVPAARAVPRPVTETAQLGDVRATLAYLFEPDAGTFTQVRFTVERAGRVVLDGPPPPICTSCEAWPGSGGDSRRSSVHVSDLDRNGEPVVLLDLYTGGAHCCLYTLFFRWDGSAYTARRHNWGNPGYRFRDVDGDGVPEFVTADDRFNYAFSCYACSAAPIRIFHMRRGKLVPVTRRFPALIRRDAATIWRSYRSSVRRHDGDPSGLLPGYLADQYLLGHARLGWARVRAAVGKRDWPQLVTERQWRTPARYLAAVRRFLRTTGYVR